MAETLLTSASARQGIGLRPTIAWGLMVLVWIALQTSLVTAAKLFPAYSTNILVLGACELLVLGGVAWVLSRANRDSPGLYWPSLAVSGARARSVLLGALLGACIHPAADAVRGVVESLWATPTEQLEAKLAVLAHDSVQRTIALFLVVALLGPLLEELFYRGVIFTRVHWAAGVGWAAFVSGAGFVFAHGDIRDWPSLALVAWALTWLRIRTGALWASVACHAAFNASTLVWLVIGAEAVPGGLVTVSVASLAAAGLLVLLDHTTRSLR